MNGTQSQQTVKEAMQLYFKEHDLGEDGGLNKTWAKIKVGRLYIPLLNIPARRKALVFHDAHHIVTGYSGDWRGEVSISAWEIASGCGSFWVAWVIDFWAIAVGLFIYPKDIYNAFIRGRRIKNLYTNTIPAENAVAMRIEDLQEQLQLKQPQARYSVSRENVDFVLYALIGLFSFLIPFIFIPCMLLWIIFK
jgi:hypothetical protein